MTLKLSLLNLYMQYGGTVYILTNIHNEVLYTGVTSNLVTRIAEHRNKVHADSFTARYNVFKLVYYKSFSRIEEAIAEEKRIKGGSRKKKIEMIPAMNPEWKDLWEQVKNW